MISRYPQLQLMPETYTSLMPETYTSSAELRTWCERNCNNFYIPEWLLNAWNISVNSDLTGAA